MCLARLDLTTAAVDRGKHIEADYRLLVNNKIANVFKDRLDMLLSSSVKRI
jgi:hypothetical protein